MHRGMKISCDPIILNQMDDHVKLEVRGRHIFYDSIIRLHFTDTKKKRKLNKRERKGFKEERKRKEKDLRRLLVY